MVKLKRLMQTKKAPTAAASTLRNPTDHPQPIVCAGLFSSGSTWAFNALAELLRRTPKNGQANKRTVVQFFTDELDMFPDDIEAADALVIKTHCPDKALQVYRRVTHAPTILAVREPRDAVASLMRRFEHSFQDACRKVTKSATHLLTLSHVGAPFLLRFEERFFDSEETIKALAAFVGLQPSSAVVHSIANSLTRESVRAKIEELHRTGVFNPEAGTEQFEPETHWHPGHVGEAVVGCHAEVLSVEQQIEVLTATEAYCSGFGYSVDDATEKAFGLSLAAWRRRYRLGETVRFGRDTGTDRFLTRGWYQPEGNFVWSAGQASEVELYVTDLTEVGDFTLRLVVTPFTAPRIPSQRVGVSVNGKLLCQTDVGGWTKLELPVPRALAVSSSPLVVSFVLPDASSPSEHYAERPDSRSLGIMLASMELAPESPTEGLAGVRARQGDSHLDRAT